MSKFITPEDYDVQARREVLEILDGTSDQHATDIAERMAIDEIRNYIGGRYDCNAIFNAEDFNRDMFIVMIAIDCAIYHLWAKKAPRKIPEYRRIRYEHAIDWLSQVGSGEIPSNLPQLPADDFAGQVRLESRYKPNNNKF